MLRSFSQSSLRVCLTRAPARRPNVATTRCRSKRGTTPSSLAASFFLAVVSPGELETCRCSIDKRLPAVNVPGEEHARCFECVKPIRDCSKEELRWIWLVGKNAILWKCFSAFQRSDKVLRKCFSAFQKTDNSDGSQGDAIALLRR